MTEDLLFHRLGNEIAQINLIDSHCHIIPFEELQDAVDLFKLYVLHGCLSFLSSGMSEEEHILLTDGNLNLEDKWRIFEPFWRKTANTGFAKEFILAMKALYNVTEITDHNYLELSARISQSYSSGSGMNWYHYVLKEVAGIDRGILDYGTPMVDRNYFYPTYRFENRRVPAYDHFITIRTRDELEKIEDHYKYSITTFDDFLKLYDKVFSDRMSEGIVSVKILLGYLRILEFQKITKGEAERVFNSIFHRFKSNPSFLEHQLEGPSWEETKLLQDFMVHYTMKLALEHQVVVQFHTGFQAGKRNRISYADPKRLNNLFIEYSNLKFALLHTGSPYWYDLACLAKNFNNVAIDFSWTNSLSPSITARIMSDFLEFLPYHKIIGFGCDNATVESALGESIYSRAMMTTIMQEKVRSGYFTEDEAIFLSRQILRENAIEYFNLT